MSNLETTKPNIVPHGRFQNVDELVTWLMGGWLLSVCRNVDVVPLLTELNDLRKLIGKAKVSMRRFWW